MWTRTQLASQCALLVSIPLDQAEFVADVERGTDFLWTYTRAVRRTHMDEAWSRYAPYARLCDDVVRAVASRGVHVIRRATLPDVTDAIGRFPTVTLCAHARGPDITEGDIVDPRLLVAAAPSMSEALGGVAAPPQGADAAVVARWLDEALGPVDVQDGEMRSDMRAASWRSYEYRQRWQRRRIIEAMCPGALAGGPALELHDGFHPLDRLDAVIPACLRTLDLTVCDSVLLADLLRARRRSGVILANARPTTPDFRLLLYREAIGLVARHGISYEDAVIRLRRSLKVIRLGRALGRSGPQ